MGDIKVVAIMGATASGKSALALSLAREFNGEIISADSAQVYRRVDIGTAKPTPAERSEIPHHLIDICDLGESFSLADFQRLAGALIDDISSRGRLPIVVGGTGLYVRGLLEGYTLIAPAPDLALREALNARDLEDLLAELQERDSDTYESIDRCNKRRVARALEVIIQTGLSFRACSKRCPPPWQTLKIGWNRPREELRQRIDGRLQAMLERGWVQEVEGILADNLECELLRANILGYERVMAYAKGQISASAMRDDIFTQTCRFAKRQSTWLRAEKGLCSVDAGEAGMEAVRQMTQTLLSG